MYQTISIPLSDTQIFGHKNWVKDFISHPYCITNQMLMMSLFIDVESIVWVEKNEIASVFIVRWNVSKLVSVCYQIMQLRRTKISSDYHMWNVWY